MREMSTPTQQTEEAAEYELFRNATYFDDGEAPKPRGTFDTYEEADSRARDKALAMDLMRSDYIIRRRAK